MIFTLKVLCFILGLCVSVQVVGALFSLVDFWSELRRHWPLVVRAIVVWVGLALILALILGETYRPALFGDCACTRNFSWGVISSISF